MLNGTSDSKKPRPPLTAPKINASSLCGARGAVELVTRRGIDLGTAKLTEEASKKEHAKRGFRLQVCTGKVEANCASGSEEGWVSGRTTASHNSLITRTIGKRK